MRKPRYPKDEFARRGKELYGKLIRPTLEANNRGRFVAIDIETGEYEMADKIVEAAKTLISRAPDAQIWMSRIGYPVVHRLGSALSR
jgi:hypothetical protein